MFQRALICTLLTLLALPASAAPAKVERRCGWFENPTPANATLTDRDGVWEIASQGGYQAHRMDEPRRDRDLDDRGEDDGHHRPTH